MSRPAPNPPFPPEVRAEALDMVRSGMSTPKVAAHIGSSDKSVRDWCRAAGVPLAPRYAPVDVEQVDELTRAGMSIPQIADHIGCSQKAVIRARAVVRVRPPDPTPPVSHAWRDRAACVGHDPETFFPGHTETTSALADIAAAQAICARCPVKADCLAWAIAHKVDGIWGGTTETGRRKLRRTA